MWIFSRVGMFSVVVSGEPQPELGPLGEVLAVRARVGRDLDDLRSVYAPELGPTVQLGGRDYPYRAYMSKEGLAAVMVRMALDIDYCSFKSMVAKRAGHFASRALLTGLERDARRRAEALHETLMHNTANGPRPEQRCCLSPSRHSDNRMSE